MSELILPRFEVHFHSEFSNIRIIDCINKIEASLIHANNIGLSGITLTDHEALCGHIEWLKTEKKLKDNGQLPQDFKCALGNEIYLVDKRTPNEKQKYWHGILIAKDDIGHRQLRELSSNAWLNSYRYHGMERVPTLKSELEEKIKENPGHLIFSSACLGSELAGLTTSLIQAEQENNNQLIQELKIQINNFLTWLINLFGDDCYIEIAAGTSKEQIAYNQRIKTIAKFYNRKIVIGCDSHFLTQEKASIHKAFLNSKDGDRDVDSFYKDAWLMDINTIINNLSSIYSNQEIEEILNNSIEIYNKIGEYHLFNKSIIPEVNVKEYPILLDNYLQKYTVLTNLLTSKNIQERYWVNECLNGLKRKDLYNDIYLSRLEIEADVIKTIAMELDNEMFAYFNTFQHYIDLFWDCGSIIGAGRGSSCSFLSNYLLGITQLDPVKWDLPWFRFLNKSRFELPDIDIDLCPSKRKLIFEKIRQERGELNVIQVATFGQLAPKAAIATACRGYKTEEYPNGLDVDISLYISSLIPVERGFTRSITDCYYGNKEKDYRPITLFKSQIDQYPGLLEIILEIENIVNRRGQHASGVILYNTSPYETGALMRSPNGDITTQFNLHDAESCGDVKYDFLLTQQVEKLSIAIDLLTKDGYFDSALTKRDIYNKYFHPDVIDIDDKNIWDLLENHNVLDLFQFNTLIGKQAIKTIKPKNPIEMSAANGLIRLTAPEGQDRPFDRYVKFKNNINLWYREMENYGLTKEEQKLLEPYYLSDYGVPSSQEALMKMVMDENISHFTLAESNKCRKIVGKKLLKEIPALKEKFLSQCPSQKLGEYAWRTMMEPQMSYSFSIIHALAYSYVAIQSLVLITKFPEIYWNCACLIVNSQSMIEEDEEFIDNDNTKDKRKTPSYDKIAKAIGEIQQSGVKIVPININTSSYTFYPDVENNTIIFGLSGILNVGEDLINTIIQNRPYSSPKDFYQKVHPKKPAMISLIKGGAFDDMMERKLCMGWFIWETCDKKKNITLQNMSALIKYNLLPDFTEEQILARRIFEFNRYLKAITKADKCAYPEMYSLDERAINFLNELGLEHLMITDNLAWFIKIKAWDKVYQEHMNTFRKWIAEQKEQILTDLNTIIFKEDWDKYAIGSISAWEMEVLCFYYHEHELINANISKYGITDFFNLSEEPEVDRVFYKGGKEIPIYKLTKICGTCIAKNKAKATATILTTSGVVEVKFNKEHFSMFDRRISERGVDGVKRTIENSWFNRGSMILVQGMRRGDQFVAKKYASNGTSHQLYKIDAIEPNGDLRLRDCRYQGEVEESE